MTKTISVDKLASDMSTISRDCHKNDEPIFIKENEADGLVIMSIEHYEKLTARNDLYKELMLGLHDVKEGRVIPADVMMENLKKRFE